MVKKGIDDLLFLAHKFLALLETVRLALDINDGAVMQDSVENGGGNGNVGENLVSVGEGFVGSKDGGGFLITSGDKLEKQISALDIHREMADNIPISSMMSILYLARLLSLSGRRFSK